MRFFNLNNWTSELHGIVHYNRKKIIFDHLPKCGGTSLNRYLISQYPKNRIFSIDGSNPEKSVQEFKNLSKKDRYKFKLIKGHLAGYLFNYVDPKCIKITMLREPVDRIVSHYYYAKRKEKHYLYAEIINRKLSLEEYVVSDLSEELRNWYVQYFSGLNSSEVESNQEIALKKATNNLVENYHIVGFLNDYNLFLKRLSVLANFKKVPEMERDNVTIDRPSLTDIPMSTIELIKNVNNLDCELYSSLRKLMNK